MGLNLGTDPRRRFARVVTWLYEISQASTLRSGVVHRTHLDTIGVAAYQVWKSSRFQLKPVARLKPNGAKLPEFSGFPG